MTFRWKKADESDVFFHCPNHVDKRIYYARIFTPRAGFEYSPTNQLILNLKIPPPVPANRQYHKNSAIEKFAQEVANLLNRPKHQEMTFTIVPVPTSHAETDPAYDDRLIRVARRVAELCSHVKFLPLLRRSRTVPKLHQSSAARSETAVYETVRIDVSQQANYTACSAIILLDDVTTSGASFEGCRRRLEEEMPGELIIGVFWAKSQSIPTNPQDDFGPLP
ncbi:MAG: hypothetical protein A2X94_09180 [Bdellovibrionales bacterium GWB1_55_8]|nr:MAG: hypothetical protein A2X94_09180 [Bdellovibrionales bacterium GWB1_55_8]